MTPRGDRLGGVRCTPMNAPERTWLVISITDGVFPHVVLMTDCAEPVAGTFFLFYRFSRRNAAGQLLVFIVVQVVECGCRVLGFSAARRTFQ